MTLALIRFVNTLLDPLQKRDKSLPLSVLATTAGLPTAFVELRHWGTHENNLPGSEVLRNMGIRALEWLWRHYWNKVEDKDDVFMRWKDGRAEVNELVEILERREEESFEKLLMQLSEEYVDFSASRRKWDPVLSTGFSTFPADFLDYTIDVLATIPDGAPSRCVLIRDALHQSSQSRMINSSSLLTWTMHLLNLHNARTPPLSTPALDFVSVVKRCIYYPNTLYIALSH
jgi:Las1-like